ncbi:MULTISPECIES: YadA-like family protein [unclassified Aminobacter]|uniref:YadA-like family protein n=1 Tax=unclassified Aminobacter TaxID=2644704 RepID=UPI00163BA385|nr:MULTISPECIES: YadA-like family protein [unclassified Aminobacter]QNH32466.1 YadA-like family protein [Aminobacter sp. MDW-2]
MSINWVNFEGENGFAGTAAMRFNDNLHLHGGIGVGARHGTVGSRAGLTFAW